MKLTNTTKVTKKTTARAKLAQLIAGVRILEMSAGDIRDMEAQEVRENPAAELVTGPEGGDFDLLDREGGISTFKEWLDFARQAGKSMAPSTEEKPEIGSSDENSVREQLEEQIAEFQPDEIREAALVLLAFLNWNGLLGASLEEIIHGKEGDDDDEDVIAGVEIPIQILEEARQKLMRLDPPGVGAFTARESLVVRLELANEDPNLISLVKDHFEDLGHERHKDIAKALGISESDVRELAIRLQRECSPFPVQSLRPVPVQFVEPSIEVSIENDAVRVVPRSACVPRIFVNPEFLKILANPNARPEEKVVAKQFVDRVRRMRIELIRRMNRLTEVAEITFRRQREAIEEGLHRMRPLLLAEIADEVEVHRSTITRCVADIWVQTPIGMVPFRKFFSKEVSADVPDGTSQEDIKAAIHAVIESENKSKPYSDQKISDILGADYGFNIARKTVNKYRNAMDIGDSNNRRR